MEFLADYKTQLATVMCLIIIGENTKRIERHSPNFIIEHPEFPWHEMKGMRNHGVHGYDYLRFETVWDTAKNSLP